jgi:hypothetical protein
MAYVFNLYMDQGSDFSQEFSVLGDLTDVAVTSKMRKFHSDNTAFSFTCTANAATNTIALAMNHIQTANIEAGKYVYDVEVHFNGLNVTQRALEGLVIVSPQVTY